MINEKITVPYEKQQQILKNAISDEKAGNQAQAEWTKTHTSKSWLALEYWDDAADTYETIISWRKSLEKPLDNEQKRIFSEALLGLIRLARIDEKSLEFLPLMLNAVSDAEFNCPPQLKADMYYELGQANKKSGNIETANKNYLLAYECNPNDCLIKEAADEPLADKKMLTASEEFLILRLSEKNLTKKEIQAGYKKAMMLANDALKLHPNASLSCHLTWIKLAATALEKNSNIKEKETIYHVIDKRLDLILEKIKNSNNKENLLSLGNLAIQQGNEWIDKNFIKMKRWLETAITCYTLYIELEPQQDTEQFYKSCNNIAGISKLLWYHCPRRESSYLNAAIIWFSKTIDQNKNGAANFKKLASEAEIALAEIYYIHDRSSDQAAVAFQNILNDPDFDLTLLPKEKAHLFLGNIYVKRNCFLDAETQYLKALNIKQETGGIYATNTILEDSLAEMLWQKNLMLSTLKNVLNKTVDVIKSFDLKFDYAEYHQALEQGLKIFPEYYEPHCLRGYLFALSGKNEQAAAQYNFALDQAVNYLIQHKPAEASKIYLYLYQHSIKGSAINEQAKLAYKESLNHLKNKPYTENTKGLMFSGDASTNNNEKAAAPAATV